MLEREVAVDLILLSPSPPLSFPSPLSALILLGAGSLFLKKEDEEQSQTLVLLIRTPHKE